MEQVKKAKLTGQVKIIETDQGSYEAKAVIMRQEQGQEGWELRVKRSFKAGEPG